jgi:hypothetical protein
LHSVTPLSTSVTMRGERIIALKYEQMTAIFSRG